MKTYEVRMTAKFQHISLGKACRTSETELVECITAENTVDAFDKALRLRGTILVGIKKLYKDTERMKLSVDAVVRKP